jgi:hypothetical protein
MSSPVFRWFFVRMAWCGYASAQVVASLVERIADTMGLFVIHHRGHPIPWELKQSIGRLPMSIPVGS